MRRGSVVMVRLANGARVEMIVWEQLKSSVLVCRPEVYEDAVQSNTEPVTVEFRQSFLVAPASESDDA